MKVLLDIPDAKAFSLLDVLHHIPYVKTKQLTDDKALLMSEIREAVEEMKLIRSGKKQARDVREFLSEQEDLTDKELMELLEYIPD
jgi:hypothetical protein